MGRHPDSSGCDRDVRTGAGLSVTDELETIAVLVHGAGAAFDSLGLYYNAKRKNWLYFGLSLVGVVFHVASAFEHWKEKK